MWKKYLIVILDAEKITLVMDNYDTHKPGSLYDTFPPQQAKDIWDRFEFVFTPKHGSWLNMAEMELNVLMGQCLSGRIPDEKKIKTQVKAWQEAKNNKNAKINWHFTTDNARIKLKSLYPTFKEEHDTKIAPDSIKICSTMLNIPFSICLNFFHLIELLLLLIYYFVLKMLIFIEQSAL